MHGVVTELPGPGVLLVNARGSKKYPRSVGAESVDGYEPNGMFLPTTPSGMPVSNWNRIQQIDPPIDATTFTYDLTLVGQRHFVCKAWLLALAISSFNPQPLGEDWVEFSKLLQSQAQPNPRRAAAG